MLVNTEDKLIQDMNTNREIYDAWDLLKAEFDKGTWPKRFPHEGETRSEYETRMYDEAHIVFHNMAQEIEKRVPDIKDDPRLDKDEEWFDEVRGEMVDFIIDTISIQ